MEDRRLYYRLLSSSESIFLRVIRYYSSPDTYDNVVLDDEESIQDVIGQTERAFKRLVRLAAKFHVYQNYRSRNTIHDFIDSFLDGLLKDYMELVTRINLYNPLVVIEDIHRGFQREYKSNLREFIEKVCDSYGGSTFTPVPSSAPLWSSHHHIEWYYDCIRANIDPYDNNTRLFDIVASINPSEFLPEDSITYRPDAIFIDTEDDVSEAKDVLRDLVDDTDSGVFSSPKLKRWCVPKKIEGISTLIERIRVRQPFTPSLLYGICKEMIKEMLPKNKSTDMIRHQADYINEDGEYQCAFCYETTTDETTRFVGMCGCVFTFCTNCIKSQGEKGSKDQQKKCLCRSSTTGLIPLCDLPK